MCVCVCVSGEMGWGQPPQQPQQGGTVYARSRVVRFVAWSVRGQWWWVGGSAAIAGLAYKRVIGGPTTSSQATSCCCVDASLDARTFPRTGTTRARGASFPMRRSGGPGLAK